MLGPSIILIIFSANGITESVADIGSHATPSIAINLFTIVRLGCDEGVQLRQLEHCFNSDSKRLRGEVDSNFLILSALTGKRLRRRMLDDTNLRCFGR